MSPFQALLAKFLDKCMHSIDKIVVPLEAYLRREHKAPNVVVHANSDEALKAIHDQGHDTLEVIDLMRSVVEKNTGTMDKVANAMSAFAKSTDIINGLAESAVLKKMAEQSANVASLKRKQEVEALVKENKALRDQVEGLLLANEARVLKHLEDWGRARIPTLVQKALDESTKVSIRTGTKEVPSSLGQQLLSKGHAEVVHSAPKVDGAEPGSFEQLMLSKEMAKRASKPDEAAINLIDQAVNS